MPDGTAATVCARFAVTILGMARGYLIAFLLSFGPTVSNSFARFAYALVLPAMRNDLALDWSQAGALNTANAFGYLAGALLARMWVGRTGNRPLFNAGMVITGLALLATGLTRDLNALALARVVSGIGGAWVFICGGAVVPDLPLTDNSAAYSAWSHCSWVLHVALVMRLPVSFVDRQIFFGLAFFSSCAVTPALTLAVRCGVSEAAAPASNSVSIIVLIIRNAP